MGSLRKEADRGRTGWRLQFRQSGKRRSLWIGSASKRVAAGVARHVEELVRSVEANSSPDAATTLSAGGLKGRMRETLERWGLVDAKPKGNGDADRLLGPFLDRYIERRTDVGDRTTETYRQGRRFLVGHFGEDRQLRSITAADAQQWRRWLLAYVIRRDAEGNPIKTMAEATVAKHVKRARLFFNEAVQAKLIEASPFASVKIGSQANAERHHFVDRDTTAAVLKACPNHDWRLIFGLARFVGMRAPSEVLTLKWSDVLWDSNRLRIDSPKTGLRFCPTFPELMPILENAFDDAPDGAVYCVERYRGSEKNLSTMLHRIIESAGCVPWEKTYINLRSTRRTELQEAFPSHVVDRWLGHSSRVAAEHYLQVTNEHWEAGATMVTGAPIPAIEHRDDDGGVLGGVIPANTQASGAILGSETDRKDHKKAPITLEIMEAIGQAGLESLAENPTISGAKRKSTDPVVPLVVPIRPIPESLGRVLRDLNVEAANGVGRGGRCDPGTCHAAVGAAIVLGPW